MRTILLVLLGALNMDPGSSWGTGYKSARAFGPPGRKVVVLTKPNALVFRIVHSLPNGFVERTITSSDRFDYEARSVMRDEVGNTFALYFRSDSPGARIHKWNADDSEGFDVKLDTDAESPAIEPDSSGGLYVLARRPNKKPVSYRLTDAGAIAWEKTEPDDANATDLTTFLSRSPQGVYELTTRGAGEARRQRLVHRKDSGGKIYEKGSLTVRGAPAAFTVEGMISAPDGTPVIAFERSGKHYLTKLDATGAQAVTIDAGGPTTPVGPATLLVKDSNYKTFSVAMTMFEPNTVALELPSELGAPRAIERVGSHFLGVFTKEKKPHVVFFAPNGKAIATSTSTTPCESTFFFANGDQFLGGGLEGSDVCVFSGSFKVPEKTK